MKRRGNIVSFPYLEPNLMECLEKFKIRQGKIANEVLGVQFRP